MGHCEVTGGGPAQESCCGWEVEGALEAPLPCTHQHLRKDSTARTGIETGTESEKSESGKWDQPTGFLH